MTLIDGGSVNASGQQNSEFEVRSRRRRSQRYATPKRLVAELRKMIPLKKIPPKRGP